MSTQHAETSAGTSEKPLASILLVEDNLDDALLTLKFFKKNNLERIVSHVSSAEEAWTILSAADIAALPKLLLVDLTLPAMRGVDLIRKIKAHKELRAIPVVVYTGSDEDSNIIETYRLHVDAYLMKPIDSFKLKKVLTIAGIPWEFKL